MENLFIKKERKKKQQQYNKTIIMRKMHLKKTKINNKKILKNKWFIIY